MKKTLLLDIDFTLMYENTPRPFLKEFLEEMDKKYDIHLYTAGDRHRVADFCRVLFHQLGFDPVFVHKIQRGALSREKCPMIDYKKEGGGYIEIKSLAKAAEILKVPAEDVIMLDDNPSFDHPEKNQIIQAEGFTGDADDNYLTRTGL
jgi:TFIIF-interacting CTD phosphatase-like protein